MFSELSKILPIKPRQAEHADTRQDIQRHDPDYERRHSKKDGPEEQEPYETGATVAVEALQHFLEEFLRNNSEEKEQPGPKKKRHPSPKRKNKIRRCRHHHRQTRPPAPPLPIKPWPSQMKKAPYCSKRPIKRAARLWTSAPPISEPSIL